MSWLHDQPDWFAWEPLTSIPWRFPLHNRYTSRTLNSPRPRSLHLLSAMSNSYNEPSAGKMHKHTSQGLIMCKHKQESRHCELGGALGTSTQSHQSCVCPRQAYQKIAAVPPPPPSSSLALEDSQQAGKMGLGRQRPAKYPAGGNLKQVYFWVLASNLLTWPPRIYNIIPQIC